MISVENYEIFSGLLFYFVAKIVSVLNEYIVSMHYKRPATLTSIPEAQETQDNDEKLSKKWVPKKKHEVLKAKYKCLKKLFQIYDASVIGILPDTYAQEEETPRRKRSYRTKTDAFTGTIEASSGDVSIDSTKSVDTRDIIRDLKMAQSSIELENKSIASKIDKYTTRSVENIAVGKDYMHTEVPHHIPQLILTEKRKLTRFQCFLQRLFGIRQERFYENYIMPNGHIYAASDNSITHSYFDKKRRRGFRFRRIRRAKKIQSDGALRDGRSPHILNFVQSIQRSCLMDKTARQCPIVGCRMMFYGIINYNDHLNLCHFTERKFICHYCHEGFEADSEKFIHENEHIGINKINTPNTTPCTVLSSVKRASDTQTDPELSKSDVPEDKLKKIVSFFDRIADPDKIASEIKKNRCSESNIHSDRSKTTTTDQSICSTDCPDKRTTSCVNLSRKFCRNRCVSSTGSDGTSNSPFDGAVACQICGETFEYRRQLSLHVDLEHRVHDKYSKFHSCAGIVNQKPPNTLTDLESVRNINKLHSHVSNVDSSLTGVSVESDTLTCDPSTCNVDSMTHTKRPVLKKIVNYKWEPVSQIVRV